MLFNKPTSLPILLCLSCGATGLSKWSKCNECGGMAMGYLRREKWLYWFYPLTRYTVALKRYKRLFNKIRLVTILIVGINFWIWFGFLFFNNSLNRQLPLYSQSGYLLQTVLEQITPVMRILFWLGIICFSYFYYRIIREHHIPAFVEHHDYKEQKSEISQHITSWKEVFNFSSKQRLNIADTFTQEALTTLTDAYTFADSSHHKYVTTLHIFYALLSNNRISNIFIRLGILSPDVQKIISTVLAKDESLIVPSTSDPMLSDDFRQVLFTAYEKAYEAHQEYVSVTELILAAAQQSEIIQEILYDLEIEQQKLLNVIEWVRVRERLQRNYQKLHHAAAHRSTKGMDKAMTAIATPFLNQFSEDVTLLAQFGHTESCVAREKELAEIFRIIEGGQQNVLLVGDFGVGKRTIVNGIAEMMVEEDVPDRIKDKRLVRLSVSSLLAGASPTEAIERLIVILQESMRSGNIILFINNIHELIGVSAGGSQSLDVADTLAEYLSGGHFLTIATTTTEAYAHVIGNSNLGNVFTQVEVKEMDENQAIQAVESKIGMLEYKNQVFFSYNSLSKAVELSKHFIHETYLPGNALEVLTETASLVKNKKGANSLVTAENVAEIVAEKTKIPLTTVSADETTKLLTLEKFMHERVVGQDEAVGLVANALRRARAEMRSQSRPIANFLFLGPTGVGKTELAKTIAEVYFGGEQRMIRLDMSEYQDKASLYRLIGVPGEKGTGILTEAVRTNPFALVLLDELEKADKDILNLFLQVMDDGRLTDSTGHVIDFTNIILIATSNAGTGYVIDQLKQGLSSDIIKDRLLHGELKEYFRPEFLNRFDGIVLFKPLTLEDVKKIVALMLKQIGKGLEAKGVELAFQDEALDYFASIGFDPDFGARPLRRILEEKVQNKLAELILKGKLNRKDVITIGKDGDISVS